MNGAILWSGQSLIDGSPVVVIVTGLSRQTKNEKIGAMVPVYILHRTVNPVEALKTGADRAICGDCPHRAGSCYVRVEQAPLAVWRAYQRGAYPRWCDRKHSHRITGRPIRLGAYGDPAAVPTIVWARLLRHTDNWTGYTHQWRDCHQSLARYLMASCETPEDVAHAHAMGWRTFRARPIDAPLLPSEIECPASARAGKRLTCAQCGACDGTNRGSKSPGNRSISIEGHGGIAKMRKFTILVNSLYPLPMV